MWSRRLLRLACVPIIVSLALLGQFVVGQTPPNAKGVVESPSDRSGAEQAAPTGQTLRDSLTRKLKEALDAAEGITGEDRDTATRILEEADAALTRIREENRRALEQANRQVRIVNNHCPNVVLFLLNGVGYGELGAYGQQLIKTPVADALAATGARFTQFYAGAPTSIASRGALYSGNTTARGEQLGDDWVVLRRQDHSLAKMLYRGGYETGLFGVWGAGPIEHAGHPNQQGFQTFFGYLDDASAADLYPSSLWRNGDRVPLDGNANGAKTQYAPDVIVEAAKRFVDKHYKRPFFLTVAFPMSPAAGSPVVPSLEPYADQDWPEQDKARAALLTRVDRYIGQIVARVRERHVLGRTLIVITSDHGPPAVAGDDRFQGTGPFRGRAGDLYEGGIRVPLIMNGPGAPGESAESEAPFAMWDLLPTLRDLTATMNRPRALDGVSMAGRLSGAPQASAPPKGVLYWESHRGPLAQAARIDAWKGHRANPTADWELYDLKADPGEARNVAGSNPTVVDQIRELVGSLRP